MHTNDLITALVAAKREARVILAQYIRPQGVRPTSEAQDKAVLEFLDLPQIKALPPELQEQVCNDYYAEPYLAWARSPAPKGMGAMLLLEICPKAVYDAANGLGVTWTRQCILRTGTEALDAHWRALVRRLETVHGLAVRVTAGL